MAELPDSQNHHHELRANLRRLLTSLFGDEELNNFAFDYFPTAYNEFTTGMIKSQKARMIVDRSLRTGRLPDLIAAMQRERPENEQVAALATPTPAAPSPMEYPAFATNPRQIFLSHAAVDADFAQRLAADLRRHGWQIWLAPDSIHPGEKWVEAINRGLSESGIFLLVLTPAAVASQWVRDETNAAISLKNQGKMQFVPLEWQQTDNAPVLWNSYQWIPFRPDYDAGLEQLLTQLQPQVMARLEREYQRLQLAMTAQKWQEAQEIGRGIQEAYADYRDVERLVTLAEKEATQAQAQARQEALVREANAARLYPNLQAAARDQDWEQALELARRIQGVLPGYRNVPALLEQALREQQKERERQQQARRNRRRQKLAVSLRKIWPLPVWGWALLVLPLLGLVVWGTGLLGGGGSPEMEAAPESQGELAELTTPTATATTTPTATPTRDPPPPNPALGDAWRRPADGMEMVWVPGGTFLMGSSEEGIDVAMELCAETGLDCSRSWFENETPQHEVTLNGFWIDRTEVTNAMYNQCVADGACDASGYASDSNFNGAEYPVVGVSWYDAETYCAWAGGQLPTEAQWEYAARGEDGRLYPWGNERPTCDLAQFSGCSGDTVPVGSFSPAGDSWVGAADMAGNVWEWAADWYDGDYYAESPAENPAGPESGTSKVLRGGSWADLWDTLRAAIRYLYYSPSNEYNYVGFRCVSAPGE